MSDYTVLLIDYDPKSIDKMRAPLSKAGYRIEVAKNGIDGLSAFKRLNPSLVLVEAMLPKKHGFEVCQEIKQSEHGASVPVVIVTAVYRGRKYRSQAFHLYKCDEYLEKPFDDAKLVDTVQRLVGAAPKAGDVEGDDEGRTDTDPKGASASRETTTAEAGSPGESEPGPVATAPAARPADPPPPSEAGTGDAADAASDEPARDGAATAESTAKAAPAVAQSRPDDAMVELTEDDIMSTLDAIMPDDAPAKSASG